MLPAGTAAALGAAVAEPGVAIVRLPEQYYLAGRPVAGSLWGGVQPVLRAFHRERAVLEPLVHRSFACRPGQREVVATLPDGQHVRHDWAPSWRVLLAKHRRYLGFEGPSRHARGQRFSWTALMRRGLGALWLSGVRMGGWRGLTPALLTLFHAWYETAGNLALRRHERLLAEAR